VQLLTPSEYMALAKKATQSKVTMTEMVLPNDTNTLNNLMGGRLLHWMDICGAISAQRHSNQKVVTASVDNVSFSQPIKLGHVVTMQAGVTRAFNSSMEVFIEVWAEDVPAGIKVATHKAFYTFVAVDDENKPVKVPELIPETQEEKEFFISALRRRQLRLVLSGRLSPNEATELKELFNTQGQ
jgi:acyl-CoA hydrolase